MRSSQISLRRVFSHIDYILGLQAKAIYIFTIIFSGIISYTFYMMPTTSIVVMPFFFLIYAALISALASEPAGEISSGTIQVYLATGLTKREYYLAWLLGGIMFQTLTFILIYAIPAFIINPSSFRMLTMVYSSPVTYGQLIVVGFLQIMYYGLVALATGVIFKNRTVAVFSVFLLMIIIPFIGGMLVSIFAQPSVPVMIPIIMLICNQIIYVVTASSTGMYIPGINPAVIASIILLIFIVILTILNYKLWGEAEV